MGDVNISRQWSVVPLKEVLISIVGGGTPSKSNLSYYEGDIPWMSVKDMNKNVLDDTIDHISQDAVDNSSTNIIPAGTPIVATRMSLGKIVIAKFDSAINQDLKALFVTKDIDKCFLIYWYMSQAKVIESLGTGTTVKGIRLENLRELRFPLPPLPEQTRIANKLDELLAQVDTIKARVDAIPGIVKRFRQSVLAAAVSGRLTEEWRVENNGRLEDWVDSNIESLCNQVRSGSADKPSDDTDGIPILRSSAVRPMEIDFSDIRYLDKQAELKDDNYLQSGDLVFTRLSGSASYVGNCALVKSLGPRIQYPDRLFCARLMDISQAPYLEIFCASQNFRDHVASNLKSSAGHQRITLGVIRKAHVRMPSTEEQTEIVRRVESLFAFADQIEQRVADAQSRIDQLTQSILAKAFRGELVPQDPNDEPASVLLARIREEREAAEKLAKAAKRGTRKPRKAKAAVQ